jgi:hypothetical protein
MIEKFISAAERSTTSMGPIIEAPNHVRLAYMRVSDGAQAYLSLPYPFNANANLNCSSRLCKSELGLPHLGTRYTTHPGYARIAKRAQGPSPSVSRVTYKILPHAARLRASLSMRLIGPMFVEVPLSAVLRCTSRLHTQRHADFGYLCCDMALVVAGKYDCRW